MRAAFWILAALALTLAACEDKNADRAEADRTGTNYGQPPGDVAAAPPTTTTPGLPPAPPADQGLTPTDQSNAEGDVRITQQIRDKLTSQDDSLSMNAQNVKVITQNGVVTLRGPVDSEREREVVSEIARSTDGVVRVDDQLDVTSR